ncbi:MAG: SDR family oxidoreductase [Gammaproteobacteria bacterium]|nr:SDR family oxidoreductase [Gammaproteobacteria bacterium]
MADVKRKTALVTGAGRGIGRATVLYLAERGVDVAVHDLDPETAAATAADCARLGVGAESYAADVSDAGAMAAVVAAVADRFAGIDILVNNAGIALHRDVDTLSETDFDTTIAVNLKSAFLCTQAVWPGMRSRGWGRIVNISSGAARGAGGVGLHYNASKAGLEGLTRGYAARLIRDGITVNAIAPSQVATDMIAGHSPADASHIPLGRFGLPEEVASAVLMVIANAYISGQTIQLNGGRHFI